MQSTMHVNVYGRRDIAKIASALTVAALTSKTALAEQIVASTGAPSDLTFVDRELRPSALKMIEMSRALTGQDDALLAGIRKASAQFLPPLLPDVPVMKREVPVGKGQPDVTVFVVNARRGASRPAILHMHGGGFIAGQARYEIGKLQQLAKTLDCVVASVEYRLAPETRYQGSTEDTYAALRWLHADALALGVDRSRIAILGGSAGGGHAALLAIKARDRTEVPVVLQVLLYPMLDDRTGSTIMPRAPLGTVGIPASLNAYGWRSFLGTEPGGTRVPSDAVPARNRNLSGLPPTFIGVGGIDLFVSEDIHYASRLSSAGVATELLVVPGAYHGFEQVAPDTMIARRFTKAMLNALRRAFDRPEEL